METHFKVLEMLFKVLNPPHPLQGAVGLARLRAGRGGWVGTDNFSHTDRGGSLRFAAAHAGGAAGGVPGGSGRPSPIGFFF